MKKEKTAKIVLERIKKARCFASREDVAGMDVLAPKLFPRAAKLRSDVFRLNEKIQNSAIRLSDV